jgi:dTDP-D-glucose 4,6-dehydratase
MSPTTARRQNFIIQALAGNDVTVYGDGTQTRRSAMLTTWLRD